MGKYSNIIHKESWVEDMVVTCKTKLSIKPTNSKAVLFYSQYPNGTLDRTSIHGGCPVLDGTKWLANLWVWNGPRNTYPGEPKKYKNAELYYKDQFWSTFGYNTIQNVNTFIGHEWNVRVNGNIVLEWIIVDKQKQNSYDSSS